MVTATELSNPARTVLARQINEYGKGGQKRAAAELGYSTAVISQYLDDKYVGDCEKLERVIINVYGQGGLVSCPVRGPITPSDCSDNFKKSKTIGMKAGNPDTLRLYSTCGKCPVRKGGN